MTDTSRLLPLSNKHTVCAKRAVVKRPSWDRMGFVVILALTMVVLFAESALAQGAAGGNAIQSFVQGVLTFLQGTTGHAICVLGIMAGFYTVVFVPHHAGRGWSAVAASVFAFTAPWFVSFL
jgi:type IV secretory pathway VirB2 component (pilin)